MDDLKAKGMLANVLPSPEAARMRDKLTRVNAGIAANAGMDLWQATQAAPTQFRARP